MNFSTQELDIFLFLAYCIQDDKGKEIKIKWRSIQKVVNLESEKKLLYFLEEIKVKTKKMLGAGDEIFEKFEISSKEKNLIIQCTEIGEKYLCREMD